VAHQQGHGGPESQKRSPAGQAGLHDLPGTADRLESYSKATGRATIVGISPVDHERVRLWSWAPESTVLELGVFGRRAVPVIVGRLLRGHPQAELFIARGAGL
jgi:hypothetical protein